MREVLPQVTEGEKSYPIKFNRQFAKESPSHAFILMGVPAPFRQGGQIAHRRERCPQRSAKQINPKGSLPLGEV